MFPQIFSAKMKNGRGTNQGYLLKKLLMSKTSPLARTDPKELVVFTYLLFGTVLIA